MQRTPIIGLIAAGGFVAAVAAILTWRFYGSMTTIPVTVSVTLWAMTAVCVLLAWRVRDRKDNHGIGQDRSQLSPVSAAQYLVIGKASAWTGAIIGGAYVGIGSYIVPRAGDLIAAGDTGDPADTGTRPARRAGLRIRRNRPGGGGRVSRTTLRNSSTR